MYERPPLYEFIKLEKAEELIISIRCDRPCDYCHQPSTSLNLKKLPYILSIKLLSKIPIEKCIYLWNFMFVAPMRNQNHCDVDKQACRCFCQHQKGNKPQSAPAIVWHSDKQYCRHKVNGKENVISVICKCFHDCSFLFCFAIS